MKVIVAGILVTWLFMPASAKKQANLVTSKSMASRIFVAGGKLAELHDNSRGTRNLEPREHVVLTL